MTKNLYIAFGDTCWGDFHLFLSLAISLDNIYINCNISINWNRSLNRFHDIIIVTYENRKNELSSGMFRRHFELFHTEKRLDDWWFPNVQLNANGQIMAKMRASLLLRKNCGNLLSSYEIRFTGKHCMFCLIFLLSLLMFMAALIVELENSAFSLVISQN